MKRNKYACIYTSSYDRGLEHLLRIWPEVKKEVPKAELHIFYGWKLFDKFYHNNPGMMTWKARMESMMKYDGVTHHGRVPQDEMRRWMKKCGIWAYPTHFGEISCISAMKAQSWGAVPVTMNYAALETTVQHGVKVEGDIYKPETKEKYKKELIKMLKNHEKQDNIRAKMMPWAKKVFGWDKVAIQWDSEFKGGKNGIKKNKV